MCHLPVTFMTVSRKVRDKYWKHGTGTEAEDTTKGLNIRRSLGVPLEHALNTESRTLLSINDVTAFVTS
jgi:hypothetical protein